ncbi:MAG: OmpH family outer membrane protein [bacterium]
MMKRILLFSFIFSFAYFLPFTLPEVRAVMLSSERIAYVDIDKIFDQYKGTKEAKEKIEREIKTKRNEIAKLEKEIKDLEVASREKKRVEPVATTGLTGEETEISTGPVIAKPLPEEVIRLNKEKLNNMVEEMKKELTRLEKEITHQILGKIYDVIREIAQAEGYAIILDKKNILYSEMENDLTEKVIQRLNLGQ